MSIIKLNCCPFCKTKESEIIEKVHLGPQHWIVKEVMDGDDVEFNMVRCLKCGLVYLNPRLTTIKLELLYEKFFLKGEIDPEFNIEQINASELLCYSVLNKLQPYQKNSDRLLDIGCGDGAFLEKARSKGWKPYGAEISLSAAKEAEKKGSTVFKGDLSKVPLPPNYFGAITCLNVLEHLEDPFLALKKFYDTLCPNAVALIRVPNIDWLDASLVKFLRKLKYFLKQKPSGFSSTGLKNMFLIQHLFYFSHGILQKMLIKTGFKVLDITTRDIWHLHAIKSYFLRGKYFNALYATVLLLFSFCGIGSTMIILAQKPKNLDLRGKR